jgi:hypothetical protein
MKAFHEQNHECGWTAPQKIEIDLGECYPVIDYDQNSNKLTITLHEKDRQVVDGQIKIIDRPYREPVKTFIYDPDQQPTPAWPPELVEKFKAHFRDDPRITNGDYLIEPTSPALDSRCELAEQEKEPRPCQTQHQNEH